MTEHKNIVEQVNSFLSTLKTTYSQQGQLGRIFIPGLFLLAFCCLCSILISLFPLGSRNSPNTIPSPNIFPTEGTQATPTALFNFDFPTFTPFPTLPPSTAFPTLTPPPTQTSVPTQIVPTATLTPIPTVTNIPATAAATATSAGSVLIVAVDKPTEYVDIQNLTNAPVDLSGWRLVSETGNQSCTLSGMLQPNEVLRIWARRGNPGFDCRFSRNIWNDNQTDPAVLYNPQGEEISRYP